MASGFLNACFNILVDFSMYLDELQILSIFGDFISKINEDDFINIYNRALTKPLNTTFMDLPAFNDRFLAAISPKIRNKDPLKYNLNNSQILMCLCNFSNGSNYLASPFRQNAYMLLRNIKVRNDLQFAVLELSPHTLTQPRNSGNILNAIRFNCIECEFKTSNNKFGEKIIPYSKSIFNMNFKSNTF